LCNALPTRAALESVLQNPGERGQARRMLDHLRIHTSTTKGDHIMPYLLGWLLGVPLIVLVILYLIFH
jgi:hypothetical protein